MDSYDEDLIYSYIIDGVNQRDLAVKYGSSPNEIKDLIKNLGFNKSNDGNWAGDDFRAWKTLSSRAGFTEQEIRDFISNYSDLYAYDYDTDFESYLQNELEMNDVKHLPLNFAEQWRQRQNYTPTIHRYYEDIREKEIGRREGFNYGVLACVSLAVLIVLTIIVVNYWRELLKIGEVVLFVVIVVKIIKHIRNR